MRPAGAGPHVLAPAAGFPLRARLDGREHVLWWGSDPRDPARDLVAVDAGRVVRAPDVAAVRHLAADRGWAAAAEEDPVLHDVDAVRAWLARTRRAVPHGDVLLTWNLAVDVTRSLGLPWADRGRARDRCYDVLLAADVPWLFGLPEFRPRWSARDLTVLRDVASRAVGVLRSALGGAPWEAAAVPRTDRP